jgi:hypothetical protein
MPNYTVLSGTRYLVNAPNEEVANEMLVAYWQGLDCPCGLPQWAFDRARELEERGELAADWLCGCVQELEVDTDIQVIHADGHPEE